MTTLNKQVPIILPVVYKAITTVLLSEGDCGKTSVLEEVAPVDFSGIVFVFGEVVGVKLYHLIFDFPKLNK